MSKSAKFPTTTWDGSSDSRPNPAPESGQASIDVYRGPDAADYQQVQAEVIALESAAKTYSAIGNAAAIATTATLGHAKIPNCAGTPTGVPADVPTGFTAIVYDTTAHKLWIYDGGWKTSGAAA